MMPSGPGTLAASQVTPAFDLDRPWRLDDRAAVRPEPFGAMLYHFGTRNLSFLKSTTLLAVLENLAGQPTARAACAAAGVPEPDLPSYARALATLAGSGMIVPAGLPAPRQVPRGPRRPRRRPGARPVQRKAPRAVPLQRGPPGA